MSRFRNPLTPEDIVLPTPICLDVGKDETWWEGVLASTRQAYDDAPRVASEFVAQGKLALERLRANVPFRSADVHHVKEQDVAFGHDLWFVGDVHGDLLGLEASLRLIRERSGEDAHIVFLGDFVDDGFHCAELITRLFQLILDPELSISIMVGNHDVALVRDWEAQAFRSRVKPGDFADWLNDHSDDGPWHGLADIFVEFVKHLPRAMFFEHGLFVAHGGFPHSDKWDRIRATGIDGLHAQEVLDDYTWNRIALGRQRRLAAARRARPSAAKTLAVFVKSEPRCSATRSAGSFVGMTMSRPIVHAFGVRCVRRTGLMMGRVLTVNNMSYRTGREGGGRAAELARYPTLAYWMVEWGAPKPVSIKVPEEVVDRYVFKCPGCAELLPRYSRGRGHDCAQGGT